MLSFGYSYIWFFYYQPSHWLGRPIVLHQLRDRLRRLSQK